MWENIYNIRLDHYRHVIATRRRDGSVILGIICQANTECMTRRNKTLASPSWLLRSRDVHRELYDGVKISVVKKG